MGVDQCHAVFVEDFSIKVLGKVVPEEAVDFTFTGGDQVREIGAVKDSVLILLQVARVQVKCILEFLREEGVGRVQIDARMIVEYVHESPVFPCAHMGHDRRQFGKFRQDLLKLFQAEEFSFTESRTDMEEDPPFPIHNHFVEGHKPFILGIEPLYRKLKLEAEDSGMIEKPLRHEESVVIIRMIGGQAVQIRICFQDTEVPFVQIVRDAFAVGIVGIDDRADTFFSQVVDTFPVVDLVDHVELVVTGEVLPYGVKEPVRKEMYMEIDDLFRQFFHDIPPGAHGVRSQQSTFSTIF